MKKMACAGSLLTAAALFLAVSPARADDAVLAAWSQVFGEMDAAKADAVAAPIGYLRFVTGAADCSGFSVRYDSAAGTGQTSPNAITERDGAFDVTVCSTRLEADWTAAHLYQGTAQAVLTSKINTGSHYANGTIYLDADHTVPAPWKAGSADGAPVSVAGPARIGAGGDLTLVTLGDTGCRGWPIREPNRSQRRYDQQCDGDWALRSLVDAIVGPGSGVAPDLVIHVGDYRYFFEEERDESWLLWQKDFFPAAQPLLLAAPWVFARGNHEGCPNAALPYGSGYFQLFGTEAGESCADLASRTTGGAPDLYSAPWFFDVRPGGIAGASMGASGLHRFVVLEVNNYQGAAGGSVAEGTDRVTTARQMVAGGPASSWWIMHTPGVELLYYGGSEHHGDHFSLSSLIGAGTDLCGTATGEGRCRPSQILLGHQHLYQDVTFPTPVTEPDGQGGTREIYPVDSPWLFPRQVIVGHGGTKLDSGNPAPRGHDSCNHGFGGFTVGGANLTGVVRTKSEQGMVVWTRSAAGGGDQSGWTPGYLWAGSGTLEPAPPAGDATPRPGCL